MRSDPTIETLKLALQSSENLCVGLVAIVQQADPDGQIGALVAQID